jgi:hypothetical protein
MHKGSGDTKLVMSVVPGSAELREATKGNLLPEWTERRPGDSHMQRRTATQTRALMTRVYRLSETFTMHASEHINLMNTRQNIDNTSKVRFVPGTMGRPSLPHLSESLLFSPFRNRQ